MSEFCPYCDNFMTVATKNNEPYQICKSCDKEFKRDAPLVLSIYRGSGRHMFAKIDNQGDVKRMLENLSWEPSMARSADVKCPKDKTNAVYMINPTTNLYIYACPTCHTVIAGK